jgi:hypothetical protein
VDQQRRIRAAAHRAKKVYPGPAGEVLGQELNAYADFDFLWSDGSTTRRMARLVDELLGSPVPAAQG